jgi:hypothetical protein
MAAKDRFNPIDCLGAALPDEEYFVLLARDPAMPALLGIWASLRVGNVAAAAENFTLLCSPDLVAHYKRHPDHAKSQEAVATANRAAEWREANVGGSNGVPTWKESLVRPRMIELEPVSGCEADIIGSAQEICPTCQEFTCECGDKIDRIIEAVTDSCYVEDLDESKARERVAAILGERDA